MLDARFLPICYLYGWAIGQSLERWQHQHPIVNSIQSTHKLTELSVAYYLSKYQVNSDVVILVARLA